MIHVDTNILVRIFTNDDKKQAKKALELIRNNQIFVAKTVFLETEWVMRFSYELNPESIIISFRKLLQLRNVSTENDLQIEKAIDLYEKGFDFGDALHACLCHDKNDFFTFDKKFVNKATKFGFKRIKLLR